MLVLFALFFFCVYLLPALTCEERERGVLLAQALSPASPWEIVAAKLIFYPLVSVAFAAVLAGVTAPAALGRWFFWATVILVAFGMLGVGMTIACITRTQRAASTTALCYLLVVSMVLLICKEANIYAVPYAFLEFHAPRLLQAGISNQILRWHYVELGVVAAQAVFWNVVATLAFRRYGWQ
jgi:hypothetical protein